MTDLTTVLGRIADALEANNELFRVMRAEELDRQALGDQRYEEQLRIQAESIQRNKQSLDALLRQDDRAGFIHDYTRTTLGLRAPDYAPREAT